MGLAKVSVQRSKDTFVVKQSGSSHQNCRWKSPPSPSLETLNSYNGYSPDSAELHSVPTTKKNPNLSIGISIFITS